ncbi:MAG: hypothetical protein RMJ48_09580 [Roseiflexaceae bacterium]|nr:hypothetical protein [Roseiflexaceae bacterium]
MKPNPEVCNSQMPSVERLCTWRRVLARLPESLQARSAYQELSVVYTTDRADAESLANA